MSGLQAFPLTLSCPDQTGIVSAVAGTLTRQDCNVLDSAQYGDPDNGRFLMRVSFACERASPSGELSAQFAPVASQFDMQLELANLATRPC